MKIINFHHEDFILIPSYREKIANSDLSRAIWQMVKWGSVWSITVGVTSKSWHTRKNAAKTMIKIHLSHKISIYRYDKGRIFIQTFSTAMKNLPSLGQLNIIFLLNASCVCPINEVEQQTKCFYQGITWDYQENSSLPQLWFFSRIYK